MIRNETFLERHLYAPELNTLVVRGVRFRVPGATDVRDARSMLGWRPCMHKHKVTVTFTYPEPFAHGSATQTGFYHSLARAVEHIRMLHDGRFAGGETLIGTMPRASKAVKVEMLG